jgi:hypothetical protein
VLAPLLRTYAAATVAIVLQFAHTVRDSQAETISVAGVAFQVDRVRAVDSKNVQVVVFGQPRIVAHTALEDEVALSYLSRPDLERFLSVKQLETFLNAALKEDRLELAYQALLKLLVDTRQPEAELLDFLALRSDDNTDRLLRFFFERVPKPAVSNKLAAYMLFMAGLREPEWLRAQALKHAYRYRKELIIQIEQEMKRLLLLGSAKHIADVLEFERTAFGAADEHYSRLKVVLGKFAALTSQLQAGESDEALQRITADIMADVYSARMLRAAMSAHLHSEAAKMLSQAQPDRALFLISLIPFGHRTPTTHETVKAALGSAALTMNYPLVDAKVEQMLERFAAKDAGIGALYGRHLERRIDWYLDRKRPSEATEAMRVLSRVRPDPNLDNDRLRRRYTALLDEAQGGEYLDAVQQEVTKELGPAPALSELFSFSWWQRLAMAVLLLLALASLAAILRYRSRHRLKLGARRATGSTVLRDSLRAEGGVNKQSSQAAHPRMAEYQRYLAVFELPHQADGRAIKNAYRAAVKTCHPDTRKSIDARASEQFIRYTETYEKLIELREEIFDEKIK